jgi:hypothetical protein
VATLTLTTIRSLVRQGLNDSLLTDDELNKIINDGYKDVAAKCLCNESELAKSSIPKIISLKGDNVIRVNYVEYAGKGLICILPQALGYDAVTGPPKYWFQWGDYLVIEPSPDSTYTISVYATCYPATILSADGDLPVFPAEFHESVYLFSLAFAALKLKRWASAVAAYNKYIADVQGKRMEYVMKSPDYRSANEQPNSVTTEERRG